MYFNFEKEITLENNVPVVVYLEGYTSGGSDSKTYYDNDGLQFDCGEQEEVVFESFYAEEFSETGEILKIYSKGGILRLSSIDFDKLVLEHVYE